MQIIPLGILVLSTALVISLFMAFFKLINFDFDKNPLSAKVIYTIFKLPILFFLLFILFIAFVVPMFEGK